MVDQEKKVVSFSSRGCFWSFKKLWEKDLIFACHVLFIREEWLSLLTLLKTGLLRYIRSEKLLQICENTFH